MSNVIQVSAKLVNHYGNLCSGIMAQTLPKPDAQPGDEATILRGRDRDPAKVVSVVRSKAGKITGYILQAYKWTIDFNTEGYAKEILWDQPEGQPTLYPVCLRGHRKGTVKDALIGRAQPFYDRSF